MRSSSHSDGGQQSFRHVGHDDANEEDDGLQPTVAQDESQDEEGDSQENSHSRDDMDEVLDLFGDGSFAGLQARGQRGDAAHDGAVAGADNDPPGRTWSEKRTRRLCTHPIMFASIP